MANSGDGRRFNELPAGEQSRYRTVAQQMVGLARDLAVPIIFAPPLKTGGEIDGATAPSWNSRASISSLLRLT
jgi:hypothetical protein